MTRRSLLAAGAVLVALLLLVLWLRGGQGGGAQSIPSPNGPSATGPSATGSSAPGPSASCRWRAHGGRLESYTALIQARPKQCCVGAKRHHTPQKRLLQNIPIWRRLRKIPIQRPDLLRKLAPGGNLVGLIEIARLEPNRGAFGQEFMIPYSREEESLHIFRFCKREYLPVGLNLDRQFLPGAGIRLKLVELEQLRKAVHPRGGGPSLRLVGVTELTDADGRLGWACIRSPSR